MFHGIVSGYFPITHIEQQEGLNKITVELSPQLINSLSCGASVSVDGVCLTVAGLQDAKVSFDVVGETLRCTTLGALKESDLVNIERSARSNDEIGGHLLSGHIDGMAKIINIEKPTNNYIITCSVEDSLIKYIFRKGYIGLNGASLTIADLDRKNNWFCIWLIPETLRLTTFALKKKGDLFNVEIERNTQVVVDTVRDFLEEALGRLRTDKSNQSLPDHLKLLQDKFAESPTLE